MYTLIVLAHLLYAYPFLGINCEVIAVHHSVAIVIKEASYIISPVVSINFNASLPLLFCSIFFPFLLCTFCEAK